MYISLISIGNSKGIRLSKTILDRYNITNRLELIMEEDGLKLKPIQSPRSNWDLEFKKMHEQGDDQLLMDDVFEEEGFDE